MSPKPTCSWPLFSGWDVKAVSSALKTFIYSTAAAAKVRKHIHEDVVKTNMRTCLKQYVPQHYHDVEFAGLGLFIAKIEK